jgi:hypothetical protein
MSQIIQGLKNLTSGTVKTFEGTTKALEGSTLLSSVGFGVASKVFKTVGKLVGGSPRRERGQRMAKPRRSKRLEGKMVNYSSPRRKKSPKKSN